MDDSMADDSDRADSENEETGSLEGREDGSTELSGDDSDEEGSTKLEEGTTGTEDEGSTTGETYEEGSSCAMPRQAIATRAATIKTDERIFAQSRKKGKKAINQEKKHNKTKRIEFWFFSDVSAFVCQLLLLIFLLIPPLLQAVDSL